MIWITSDFHFSHPNITGPSISRWSSGYRDFDSIHKMNETITNAVNKYVKKEDTLYFGGDWCFGGHEKTPMYRNFLNVDTIHFMIGNHDKKINLYKDSFSSLNKTLDVEINGRKIHFSHYPYVDNKWPGRDEGVIHLYGHTHGNREDVGLSMDMGIDVAYRLLGEYRPFSIDEIFQIMDAR